MNKLFPINITRNAWKKIIEISKIKNNNIFLLSVKSGGCNGFNYTFENIENQKYDNINKIENQNVKILIDPKSELLLIGTKIDYIKEDIKNSIYENKFIFSADKDNNISCGCGTSFSPKIKN